MKADADFQLPAEMTLTAAQRRLGATITGSGDRVLVFANGLGTSQHTWRHIVDGLQTRARCIRFDNVCSPVAPPGGYRAEVYGSLYAYVDDVVELLDELDVHDVLFVGHSISGMIGLLAAIVAPQRIGRLALINSTPRYLEAVDFRFGFPRDRIDALLLAAQTDYAAWVEEFALAVTGPGATDAQTQEFRELLGSMRPDVAFRTLQLAFLCDVRTSLARVTQPVYVMHAREDAVVPSSAGEYMVQRIPRAQLLPLSARTHLPHLVEPNDVVQHLHRILDAWT